MNPFRTYEEFPSESLSGRELEAALLVRAACGLKKCVELWPERHSKESQQKLDEALRFNQKLWTLLQVELSNPENRLPESLRTNLLRLSRYIDQKTFSLFSGGELGDLQMLSKINEEVAAGLMAGAGNRLEEGDFLNESSSEESQVCDITG
jgi:flagellar protein FlaF